MPLFDKDIALDMGTTRVMLYLRGKGVALREPTLVAVDKFSGKLLKVGEEAQKMLGRTPASIVPIQPIVGGVISDYDRRHHHLGSYGCGVRAHPAQGRSGGRGMRLCGGLG